MASRIAEIEKQIAFLLAGGGRQEPEEDFLTRLAEKAAPDIRIGISKRTPEEEAALEALQPFTQRFGIPEKPTEPVSRELLERLAFLEETGKDPSEARQLRKQLEKATIPREKFLSKEEEFEKLFPETPRTFTLDQAEQLEKIRATRALAGQRKLPSKKPFSTQSALDSGFSREEEMRELFPEKFLLQELELIPVSEVQRRRQETLLIGREERAEERKPEFTAEIAGRVGLAKESIKNIEDVKKMLFPDGTEKSFRRDIAASAAIPTPWGKKPLPFNTTAQDVYRKIGASLSGRLLIQTGIASRPEEVQALYDQFAPGITSAGRASLSALNELQAFYGNFIKSTQRPSKQERKSFGLSKPEELKRRISELERKQ